MLRASFAARALVVASLAVQAAACQRATTDPGLRDTDAAERAHRQSEERALRAAVASATPPAGSTSPLAPEPPRVSIDGKDLPIAGVFAKAAHGRAIELHFASKPEVGCAEVLSAYDVLTRDTPVMLAIAPVLAREGPPQWRMVQLFASGVVETRTGAAVEPSAADASPGGRVRVRVAIHEKVKGADDAEHAVDIEGAVDAIGCGARDLVTRPIPDRPQRDLGLRVGSIDVPVHGALVRVDGDGRTRLRLASAPQACDDGIVDGDVVLDLVLDPARRLRLASLGGRMAPTPSRATVFEPPRDFAVRAGGPLRGSGSVEVALRGDVAVEGIPVHLDGRVTALRCPR